MKNLAVLVLVVFVLSSFCPMIYSQSFPMGGRVAFTSDRTGTPEVWVLDLETNQSHQVTFSSQPPYLKQKFYPKWSADGRRIAFGSRVIEDPYAWQVYIVNDDGTGLRQITSYEPATHAYITEWDPNDPSILYVLKFINSREGTVVKINVDSDDGEVIIPNNPGSHTQYFTVTPDGKEILFSREPGCCWGYNMFTGYQDMAGASSRIILPTDGIPESVWDVNRTDNWILFMQGDIFKMDKNGSPESIKQLTFNNPWSSAVWTFGDNNSFIIFASTWFGDSEIVTMPADGESYPVGMINLSQSPGNDVWPDWTPTGGKRYIFEGFTDPIANFPTVNKANAGQTVPVKWRLTDTKGIPITDPSSFASMISLIVDCATFEGDPTNIVEESFAGDSGLQYLGDGWWQYNWKTQKAYKGQCRTLRLTLDDKSEHSAAFSFK